MAISAFFRLFLLGGSDYFGSQWSLSAFERVDGEWIEKVGIENPGKAFYIESRTLQTPSNAVILDTDKSYIMEDKCMRTTSPDYPNNVNANLKISLPFANKCLKTSMKFHSAFNLSCSDSFISISYVNEMGQNVIIGTFCGDSIPDNSNMVSLDASSFNIHFKSGDDNNNRQGFMLKLCREIPDGKSGCWQDWNEWTYHRDCEHSYRTRERKCLGGINQCIGPTFEEDVDTVDELIGEGQRNGHLIMSFDYLTPH